MPHENRIPLNGGPERRVDASQRSPFAWVAVDSGDASQGLVGPGMARPRPGIRSTGPCPPLGRAAPPRASRRPCCSPRCATPRRRMNRQSLHSLLFHVGLCAAPLPRPTASCPLLPPYIRTRHETNPNAPLPRPVRRVTNECHARPALILRCLVVHWVKRIPGVARRPCTRLNRCRCSLRPRLPVRRRWRSVPGCRTMN